MNEEEILEAITTDASDESGIEGARFISSKKLAAFLAKHLTNSEII